MKPLTVTVSLLGVLFGIIENTGSENCDKMGTLLYEDMGCKPVYDRTKLKTCPSKYDCLGLRKSNNNNCYFKGKRYNIDEQVDSKLTVNSCDLGCFCEKENDKMKFKCAALECPEWRRQPLTGCYRKYSLNDCCSVKEVCAPFDDLTKCVYDGKEYKEGENFFPRDSCWRCVCQQGFRGKIEKPFCRRKACGAQIKNQDKLQERCAPLYYKKAYRDDDPLCCPALWVCSEGNEDIIGRPKSDKKCLFGKRIIRAGQYFEKTVYMARNITVSCECKLPPLLTCTTDVF